MDGWMDVQNTVVDALACSLDLGTIGNTVLTNGTFVFRRKNGGEKLGLQHKTQTSRLR